MSKHKSIWLIAILALTVLIVACEPTTTTEIVEVTRVITETVEVGGDDVEVTRIVTSTETIEVTRVVSEEPAAESKELVVCMAQEPDTLYTLAGGSLVQGAVQHGFYENLINTLSYDFQAQGIEKLPSLADDDASIAIVTVAAGDTVVDANGDVATLEAGMSLNSADGETVEFDGEAAIEMEQMVVDFALQPLVWEDGVPVTADDSVFGFEMASDPDTPSGKFVIERTASYEATGDLSLRWTGVPGYLDSTYFTNIWQPMPRHVWGDFTAAELVEAEESARMPLANGPFRIEEWVAGDHILLVKNEMYYRADEGLPKLESVTFKFIPDTNQLVAQLLAGQCDIGTQDGLDVTQSPFLIEAESQGLLVPYFQTGTVFEHIDFGIDPIDEYASTRPDWFEDVRVRQAMTMCTDRQSMVDNILYGRSEVIHTYIPSVHPLYPEGLTEWPYDVEAANALLDEVGWTDGDDDGFREHEDGTPFAVTLGTTSGNEMRQQLTQIFKENMIDCGIDIELYYLPASEWFANGPEGPLFGRKFDLGEFAWLTGVEPSCGLYLSSQIPGDPELTNPKTEDNYLDWGGANETGWVNEAYDEACNIAVSSLPGTAEYEDSHKEAQRIFSEDVPVIPLFLRLKVAAARPEVCNFSVDPTQNSELYNLFEIDLGDCE